MPPNLFLSVAFEAYYRFPMTRQLHQTGRKSWCLRFRVRLFVIEIECPLASGFYESDESKYSQGQDDDQNWPTPKESRIEGKHENQEEPDDATVARVWDLILAYV
jgi:hypothetical protein